MVVADWKLPCRYLIHDRDASFAALDGVSPPMRCTDLTPQQAEILHRP